jgi:hypothetical protein
MMPARRAPATLPDSATIDATYGLEPVIALDAGHAPLSEFVTLRCPHCGEEFGTALDLSSGSFRHVEDCQVCCQPIELSVRVRARGGLRAVRAHRA